MSGNGRGAQRPQSRPPFLVIGLLVAMAILAFNYWNLSSANSSLEATNIDLQDQIRILTSKRLTEEQTKKELDRKYTLLEQRIAVKDSEIKTLQSDVDAKRSDQEKAETAKKDCETNLQTCESNNSGIQDQLGEVNKQLEEFKKKQDQQPNCDSQCQAETKKVFSEIFQKAGAPVMQQIINAGINVGDNMKVQVQQAAGSNNQVQPPQQKQNVEEKKDSPQPQGESQKSDTTKAPEVQQGSEGKTNTNSTDGLLGSVNNLKEVLKHGVKSLTQNLTLHDIFNQTQESIKMGLKKSQDLAGHLIGGARENMHESSNSTIDNDVKNDTLVGTKVDKPTGVDETKIDDTKKQTENGTKHDDNKKDEKNDDEDGTEQDENKKDEKNEAPSQIKPPHEQGQKETKKGEQFAKIVKDVAYEDDDEDVENDKVEESKDLKYQPKGNKEEEDNIDALGKRLNSV